MTSLIQKNCYWSIVDQKMVALCEKCKPDAPGWFWEGVKQGYGDYDLRCHKCNAAIHIRETND